MGSPESPRGRWVYATVPLITKQPALRAGGTHANYETSDGRIGDVEGLRGTVIAN